MHVYAWLYVYFLCIPACDMNDADCIYIYTVQSSIIQWQISTLDLYPHRGSTGCVAGTAKPNPLALLAAYGLGERCWVIHIDRPYHRWTTWKTAPLASFRFFLCLVPVSNFTWGCWEKGSVAVEAMHLVSRLMHLFRVTTPTKPPRAPQGGYLSQILNGTGQWAMMIQKSRTRFVHFYTEIMIYICNNCDLEKQLSIACSHIFCSLPDLEHLSWRILLIAQVQRFEQLLTPVREHVIPSVLEIKRKVWWRSGWKTWSGDSLWHWHMAY